MGQSTLGTIKLPYTIEDEVLANLHTLPKLKDQLDEVDIFGETLLIRSLRYRMYKVAQYLVDHGANLDVTDISGRTAFSYALTSGNSALVEAFLSRGVLGGLEGVDKYNAFLALCLTAKGGGANDDVSHIHHLLDKIDLDIVSPESEDSFIFFAIDTLSANLVKLYIDRGGTLFVRDRLGMSPLTYLMFKERELHEVGVTSVQKERVEEIRTLLKSYLIDTQE